MPEEQPMVLFKDVEKVYRGGNVAVEHINLEIHKGDFVCLIGTSGSGKTTTMRMINRMLEPSGGQILFNGKDIHKIDAVKLRRQIGYVIQNIGLMPHMTIYENITIVPKLLKWPEEKRREKAKELLDLVELLYQGKHSFQGNGIGLSYAKQLVEMHGGIIGAQNNETKGATFFFTLPYRQEAADIQSTPQTYLNDALHLSADIDYKQPQQDSIEKFHSILIVEDDRDLCNYLICNLQVLFEEVYEAHDGMEALPILTSQRPQIVLSDVKMPRMNGFELCRYIKQKPDLNYMPVILLTSCVDDASIEEGYKTGAEAYITKPFDMDLLSIQIQNIMHNHNIVKKHYATIDIPIPKQENLNHINEQLMLQFSRIVNENISNVDMDVNFIAKQMGMSRASLYNKTKGMMDIGISEYIIKCRLEYARKLLDATTLSISEVAEQSGFKHSRNFSTVFKNAMGMSPSDYRKKDSRPS